MSEGPVNLNWGPIMKHINESPFEFFQGGGWDFLGTSPDDVCCLSSTTFGLYSINLLQGDQSDVSNSESDFEADPEDLVASSSSQEDSDYGSDGSGSDVSGSDFGGGDDESDEGL